MSVDFQEVIISQIPALQLLTGLGYQYLTPAEAMALRGHNTAQVLLEPILTEQLTKLNQIHSKGQGYAFSPENITLAVRKLRDEPFDGLISTNARLYERLTTNVSLEQTIDGDKQSHNLSYIDWLHPERNVYHVTTEFSVRQQKSHETRRPDIVLFVNGIPLVEIECKRPDLKGAEKPIYVAIKQLLDYQRGERAIPRLFVFSQLLVALCSSEASYATTATPRNFWATWQEEALPNLDNTLSSLINRPLSPTAQDHLYNHWPDAAKIRQHFATLGQRIPTPQDRLIYSLLQPARLLELIDHFIVFDDHKKKIARYQQYFAVKQTLHRVAHLNHQGRRTGGVIWHTTGSGKSLTMVMLAKALARHPNIKNPKVVLVTDRTDLDRQLKDTFLACGLKAVQATSGQNLVDTLRQKGADLITTIINKFETAAQAGISDPSVNIFVLVDESHRSHYGLTHAKMRQVFPAACYIGFTGTPLTKKEKSTAQKFGHFIHKYTLRRAVEDRAVVPLLYEGRMEVMDVEKTSIDRWFERVTCDLNEEQKRDLKRKFSQRAEISRAEQRLRQIAYDLSDHYVRNFQNTGLKAQLAAPSKAVALRYKALLDEFGLVSAAVVISAPDLPEGDDEGQSEPDPKLAAFWREMMTKYGSEKQYNKEIVKDFGKPEGVEVLIVVDKLLTGFDEPRNTVLYLDKPLKEHTLLQAIARVNRVFEDDTGQNDKEFGYIVDYRGVLGHLNEALNTYNALEAFDQADIAATFHDIREAVAQLPQHHAAVWAILNQVPNRYDSQALIEFLGSEDRRQAFYEALTTFTSTFKIALSNLDFYQHTPEGQIETYKQDLKTFHNLRQAVKHYYAESIDYQDYEAKIRKLIDSHLRVYEVEPLTDLVNIFDEAAFEAELAHLEGDKAKADTIANRVKHALQEKMAQDPAYYKKFSTLIDETIASYKQGRLSDLDYLETMQGIQRDVVQDRDDDSPAVLSHYKDARAYYGRLQEIIEAELVPAVLAEIAIDLEEVIEANKVRDWQDNAEVQNEMCNHLEDYLYEQVIEGRGIDLSETELNLILENLLELARQRDALR